MKTLAISLAIMMLSITSNGQTKFEQLMLRGIDSLYATVGTPRVDAHINTLERLSLMDTSRWEPLYYASWGLCLKSFNEKEAGVKDALSDKAMELCNKALLIAPNESELHVLHAFVLNAQVVVNPMVRGASLMSKIYEDYDHAIALDSLNPRAYYMKGNTILNSPAFIGGGKKNALPLFEKANQRFCSFASTNPLVPRWGHEKCQELLEECRKQ